MSFETMARMGRGERPRVEVKKPNDGALFVIEHPGFCNPVAIANEGFRRESLIENQMRGGWTETEAIQMLREKGKID